MPVAAVLAGLEPAQALALLPERITPLPLGPEEMARLVLREVLLVATLYLAPLQAQAVAAEDRIQTLQTQELVTAVTAALVVAGASGSIQPQMARAALETRLLLVHRRATMAVRDLFPVLTG